MLKSVCKVLYLDSTSFKRSRARMGKVKMQIDLTKTRASHVLRGLDAKDDIIGLWQLVDMRMFPHVVSIVNIRGLI